FDAYSLPAPNGLTFATEAGTAEVAINGQPLLTGADVLLPLHLGVATAGTYTLAVDELLNLPTNYHAYLRDALTGAYTDLATTPALSLSLAANGAAGGRYAVLFTTRNRVLATAPAALAQLASVYPNPAHATAALLLPVALRGNRATGVSVLDNLGRVVLTRTLPAGATDVLELPLAALAPGVYSVLAHT
ncbi:T9SS type A sorting domain-containing protein, partial [Hymenobacter terricola]